MTESEMTSFPAHLFLAVMAVLGFLARLHVVLGQAISPPSQGRSLPECKKKALDLGSPNGHPISLRDTLIYSCRHWTVELWLVLFIISCLIVEETGIWGIILTPPDLRE